MSNNNNKSLVRTNFVDFLNTIGYNIDIPVIQRDYAQGRPDEERKRNAFIKALLDALSEKRGSLGLDFIYGKSVKALEKRRFEPLDGQQRLTTLFLLLWLCDYRANKSHTKLITDALQKFTYKTRISSERFCHKLIVEDVPDYNEGRTISSYIKNLPWFSNDWNYDPTVSGMLTMLDAIDEKLATTYKDRIDIINKNLANNTVHFDVLDMGEEGFDLSDSLYIKMNSRGKQLTNFENWKAKFIDFLDNNFNGVRYKDTEFLISDYFSQHVEHEWTDMLWDYAIRDWNNIEDERKKENSYPLIDNLFMNFYAYIFRILYYIKYPDDEMSKFDAENEDQRNDIFSDVENLSFLFQALDLFYQISKDSTINNFFNSIFFISEKNKEFESVSDYKVRLFEANKKSDSGKCDMFNLFDRCIYNEDFDTYCQILLYALIKYAIKYDKEVTSYFKNYLRVIRNLLSSIIQKTKDLGFASNLRINGIANYDKVITLLSSDVNVTNVLKETLENTSGFGDIKGEIRKNNAIIKYSNPLSKLCVFNWENSEIFKGTLASIPDLEESNLRKYNEAISYLFNINESLRIRTLVANGFDGYWVNDYFVFYGNNKHDNNNQHWDMLFHFSEGIESIKTSFSQYLSAYHDDFNPEEVIREALKKNDKKHRNYYILKYPDFIDTQLWNKQALHYFNVEWDNDGNDLDLKAMNSYSSSPLQATNAEPMAYVVLQWLLSHKVIMVNPSCQLRWYKASLSFEYSGLHIKMSCWNDGWHIESPIELPQVIKNKYNLSLTISEYGNYYILKESNKEDRVTVCEHYLSDLLNLD